jgi:hypothetical protein
MTPSPDLIAELRAARPVASQALRLRVREIATSEAAPARAHRFTLPTRRAWVVALPAAAAVALASAGALGLARSGGQEAARAHAPTPKATTELGPGAAGVAGSTDSGAPATEAMPQAQTAPAPGRAQQVSATLTVEVRDSDAVAKAAQDALDLTRSLGGYIVSSSVSTGGDPGASLVVRVPVTKVQDAVAGLSGLGRIVSQQVNAQDVQESLDALVKREATVRSRIAVIRARLASRTLDPATAAALRSRLATLRAELVQLRQQIAATSGEARMSTIQLEIVTPGAYGAAASPKPRIDRTVDEALNVLAWEGIVALGAFIVIAPLALAGVAVWLGRRLYRRREEERLLAT